MQFPLFSISYSIFLGMGCFLSVTPLLLLTPVLFYQRYRGDLSQAEATDGNRFQRLGGGTLTFKASTLSQVAVFVISTCVNNDDFFQNVEFQKNASARLL